MTGPIYQAINALEALQSTVRDHSLVTKNECVICRRIIEGGLHADNCPYCQADFAVPRLRGFLIEVVQT